MPNFLLIDKPSGITSHDVVDYLRRVTGVRRIGHAGTLDPFATGLLILGIGREATRELWKFFPPPPKERMRPLAQKADLSQRLTSLWLARKPRAEKSDKEYIATLHLGAVSDTYDRTGKITEVRPPEVSPRSHIGVKPPQVTDLQRILKKFIGETEQIPPMFSAKKINGKKMYELARRGIEVERKPVKIKIYDLEILEYTYPFLKIRVHSSSGTYIRSLAHDIGQRLKAESGQLKAGYGAYLEELRRTKIGKYNVKDAHKLEELTPETWIDKVIKMG